MKQNSVITFFGVVILLIACFQLYYNHKGQPFPPISNTDSPTIVEKNSTVRVAATGDIMLHLPQIASGHKQDGSYDFNPFFKEIKSYFSKADISIANLETSLGGTPPYSGYPRFNAPDALINAIRDSGINLVSTANNHALDLGEAGLKRTYGVVNKKGIKTVGTADSPQNRKATIITKNNIKLAFLAYTESTNGLPVPKTYLLNVIDPAVIKKDIKEAKAQGAEFVIVSLHFGQEYQRQPNEYQRNIAQHVFESGADVILGSHPHVIQPMKRLKIKGKDKFIIYSMGNFISNQKDAYTDEGVIVYLDIEKKNGKTTLKNVSYLPTFCHKYYGNGKAQYVVIPTEEKVPVKLPQYPGITRNKWVQSFNHTSQQLTMNGLFSVAHLN